ncbi:MAG TPA: hypothetical protein VGR71_12335 [Nitrospira sp.]|nr:hypothetical protein [Nitrospira sp.]
MLNAIGYADIAPLIRMGADRVEWTRKAVLTLRDRRPWKDPHRFETADIWDTGCRHCGYGSGALLHNEYLVRDYELLVKHGVLSPRHQLNQ